METWFDVVTKEPVYQVLMNWVKAVNWKDEAEGSKRVRPIQAVRVLNEAGQSLWFTSSKNVEHWTEEGALLELLEFLENELVAELHPATKKLKIQISPWPDEKESRSKVFSTMNLAQMHGRSLRPDEIGTPAAIEGAPSASAAQTIMPFVQKLAQPGLSVSVNLSELLEMVIGVTDRAYKPVYSLVNTTVDSLMKIMELQKFQVAAIHETLSQHPQVSRFHYEHELALRTLDAENQRKLMESKEENKAKVIGHLVNNIGGTPQGQEAILEMMGKINKLLP